MSELSYIRTTTLEAYVASDGQRFTDLIKRWAQVYFPRIGIQNHEFSINGVSFRPDGGTDGIVNAPNCSDPLRYIEPKSAFQFKAGHCTKAKAKEELTKEPEDGSTRIIDFLKSGHKLVWFTGKGLTDPERVQLEKDLAEIVDEIQTGLPKPLVIDANRLCQCLSRTPIIAASVVNAEGLFMTAQAALSDNPHARFAKFVPGASFEAIRADVEAFFLGSSEPVKYLAGEPGIGKSRTILEAIEATPTVAGSVCYFRSPTTLERFFTLAIQEGWVGYCLVDDYIGETAATISVTADTIPKGIRVILIGHSHLTNRKAVTVTNELEPLTEAEMVAALAATFPALEEFKVRSAISLSRQNLRLARSICEYLAKDPQAGLDLTSLEKVVDEELRRMPSGKQSLAALSLVPLLVSDDIPAFCSLVGIDDKQFAKDCREVNQQSGLIQANDSALYVGARALGQVALVRWWREDRASLERILKSPGQFFDAILTSIRRLALCSEKEEMLAFFQLPVAELDLPDLMDEKKGRQLLQLLTADPETYLPAIHRVITEHRGHLSDYPYEGGVGRRDLIWKLRDIAQFAEYFVLSEEIVYLLAREEVASPYHNVATSYWPTWFGACFDNTVYPYGARLDLLENRLKSGDDLDRKLVLSAIDDPFPHVGSDIPSVRVGGRLAPPELRFIHHAQIRLAAERIPLIVDLLLSSGDSEFNEAVGDRIAHACFSWLEVGAIDAYTSIVTSSRFPKSSLQALIVRVRHYVSLRSVVKGERDPHIEWMHEQHQELLSRIDDPDPFIEVLEIADHGYWGDDESDDRYQVQVRVLEKCLSDPEFRNRTLSIMADSQKHGGGALGKSMGPYLTLEEVVALIDRAKEGGFSPFAYAAIRRYVETHDADAKTILDLARRIEGENPRTAIALYQALGDDVLFEESARVLEDSSQSSALFGHFWLRSFNVLSESAWKFVRAVAKRLESGTDPDTGEVALNIAGEFARAGIDSAEAITFGLATLRATDPERGRNSLNDWDNVGKWLLAYQPQEVIEIAASKDQSEFSHATAVLAEAAPMHSLDVLNSLRLKLEHPYEPPFLLTGGLKSVIQGVDLATFTEWLPHQNQKVLESLAGHLPKPVMDGGHARIPELTLAFWTAVTPDDKAYKRAMSSFAAHTFNTGVFGGFGVDLFSERVTLAKQLLNHPNAAIRSWAEGHLQSSEHQLENAKRRQDVHAARVDTSG